MFKLSMSLKHLKLTYLKNCQKSVLKNNLMTQNTLLNYSIFFNFQKNKIAFNFSINKDNNDKEYQSQFMSTQNKKQQNQQNKKDSFQQEKNINSKNKKKQSEHTQKDEIFPNMNYYEILGFQKNIVNPTQEEIKAAYLDAVKKYHPDLSNDKLAVQKFQIIQKVYEVLSDPQKRSQYRASLKLPVQQGQTYEAAKRFKQQFKNYDKIIKQRAPDQWQFSYKLYKQHYEKLQVAKKNYKKYHGQDKQYWVSNDQIPIRPKAVIQAVSMIAGSVFIGSCAFYYIWN